MDNESTKKLCLDLLFSDTEEGVISVLKNAGYWDDPCSWRLYGDKEGNFSIAGSQQAEPEAALVEKIINSVDACLIGKCLLNEIAPESEQAPGSIRNAVARFYENKTADSKSGGVIKEWSKSKLKDEASNITLAAPE